MPDNNQNARLQKLYEALKGLTAGQLQWIEEVAKVFAREHRFWRMENSDLVSPCLLQDFGDALRIHHCFSREPFTKDKFEYAYERVAKFCGLKAELASRGNPGHDITINDLRFSLKTQADKNLKLDKLHISKFMELGKGQWSDKDKDLIGLRDQFFKHMQSYDRILSLRSLVPKGGKTWHYELVEIPKPLLMEAKKGELRMARDSKQMRRVGCITTGIGITTRRRGGTSRVIRLVSKAD